MLEKLKSAILNLWLFDDSDPPVEHSVLKMRDAYLCINPLDDAGAICGEVFRCASGGTCPDCGSQSIRSLSWLLKGAAERQEWLDRIGAKRRRLTALSRKATGPGRRENG